LMKTTTKTILVWQVDQRITLTMLLMRAKKMWRSRSSEIATTINFYYLCLTIEGIISKSIAEWTRILFDQILHCQRKAQPVSPFQNQLSANLRMRSKHRSTISFPMV
jgi:hypothetical protein